MGNVIVSVWEMGECLTRVGQVRVGRSSALKKILEVEATGERRQESGPRKAGPERRGQMVAAHPLTRLSAAAAVLLCLGLLAAAPARAGFEGVGYFGGSAIPVVEEPVVEEEFAEDEEVQLGGVSGLAVNYTGAGGVKAGAVYAATKTIGEPTRVAMYVPEDGGLKFWLGWEVTTLEGPYERCGPGLGVDGEGKVEHACPLRAEGAPREVDVDVDQATGNVYVDNGTTTVGRRAIVAYKPDGSEVISRFGEIGGGGKPTVETLDKIHSSLFSGAIAVNSAGEVYVFDLNPFDEYHRLMKFVPKVPGNFSEYIYAPGEDLGAGFPADGQPPSKPVEDAAGNVYVASNEAAIEMYDPTNPGDPPVCTFKFTKGGITMLTVDPASGEVFFFSYKTPKRIHQLSPCDPETGEFKEVGQVEVKPERDDLWGLAFDPKRQLEGRLAGVLYAGAPAPVPSSGVGKGEPGQSSLGYIFARAKESPPVVKSEWVSKVTSSSAELHAEIDPEAFKTGYVFQYLTAAAYVEAGASFAGAAEAPPGGAVVGEGKGAVAVAATLVGLTPDTEYRYRVIATSECSSGDPEKLCEDVGETQPFRTYPVQPRGPVDGRAYELVSPARKSGGEVFPADPRISSCGLVECKPGGTYQHFPMLSTADGEAVAYEGYAFAPGEGAAVENEHVARRTPSGWKSTNPTPQLLRSKGGQGYKAFNSTLSEAVLAQSTPSLTPEAPSEYENLYAQPVASPLALRPLVTSELEPHRSAGEFKVSFAGAAADLSRVFFTANDALSEETAFAPPALDGGAGEDNLYEWEQATGQLRLVNVLPGNLATEPGASFGPGSAHTISEDGRRAFWSDAAGQAFVREGAEETREIPDAGAFLAAAIDGSRVLLGDGHIYDLETEATTDLTAGKGGFEGLAGQSDDLTHVFFVDSAVLDEEENSEGDKAQAGKDNLYAWSEGTTGFVATLLDQDNDGSSITLSRDWADAPSARTAEASPNGRFVAFLSQARLTGYGNVGPCELIGKTGELTDAPCPEAFFYDSATGVLNCASCSPSGAAPLGWSALRLIKGPASLPQPRYLTDSGRLYFDSQDSLSPFDTNEGIEDVYQFEPQEIGDCEREGGCVALISAGRSNVDSNFLAADATGKNVFFTSRDRLVAADQDGLIDLYDAREGGGTFQEPESRSEELPLQIPPFEPTPASPTLDDPGNVKPPKACRKGEVKKNGKCVKKRQKPKKKNGSKRQKRGGAK